MKKGEKMSEEKDEMVLLLKELVSRLKTLEEVVYDNDNLLMKSGLVKVTSPSPTMSVSAQEMPTPDTIAKMDWADINKMVTQLEGGLNA